MQQSPQAPQMTMPNNDRTQYQQAPAQGMYQPGPTQPSNSDGQQPYHGQVNAAGAPSSPLSPQAQQQPPMPQQTFHQPQQAQYPQGPNMQPQAQPTNVQFAPPLPQVQQPAATPFNKGHGKPSTAGNVGKAKRGIERIKLKAPFRDRNMGMSGQSIVGRKGKDGEFMEVRCSIM